MSTHSRLNKKKETIQMKQVIKATPGYIKENHEACLTFLGNVLNTN